MNTRVRFFRVPIRPITAGAILVLTLALDAPQPHAQGNPQSEALARLRAGNARFVADASEALPVTPQRRTALAQGQSPFAMVLSCADSRVPPEIVFHTGLGDLFVIRSVGHVTDRAVLASLEYGAEQLRVPLLVVMGHEMCGAVKATVDSASGAALGPNAEYLLKSIRPAASRVANQPAESRLRLAILENVEESINTIIGSSATLRQLSEANKLLMVGAYYELASGRVLFSQPVAVPPQRSAPPVSRSTEAHGASSPRAAAASSTPAAASAAPPTPSTSGAAPPAAPPAAAASSSAKPAAPSSSSAKPAAAAPKPAAGAAPATASATPIKPASAPPKSAPVPGPVSVSVPVSSSH